MNLNEAITVLKENDYIVEFLTKSVTLKQLVNLLVKNNIISKNVAFGLGDWLYVQNPEEDLTEDDVYDFTEKMEKFIDRIATFIKKYGWEYMHTSYSKDSFLEYNTEHNAVQILLYNRSEDTHDYGNEFYHQTNRTKEQIIDSGTGLRVKTVMSDITEPKIYLVSAKILNMDPPGHVIRQYNGSNTLERVLSYYADHEFGDYLYKITLPDNYIVKKDAEHGDLSPNSPEVYVTQNIPAKFITYVGNVNDMY